MQDTLDPGLDSMERVELFAALEQRFGVLLPWSRHCVKLR